ncbi:MAG: hypothetical protein QXP04_04240 [Candidatus Nanoarchaeia archaeon]|nr:hypothetical protein [Candidatus Jingweiarchaeum tengchongense]
MKKNRMSEFLKTLVGREVHIVLENGMKFDGIVKMSGENLVIITKKGEIVIDDKVTEVMIYGVKSSHWGR